MGSRLISALLLSLALAALPIARAEAETVDPKVVAKRLGLSDAQIAQVVRGEVVAHDLVAEGDKTLSLALVAVVDASLEHVYELLAAERLSEISSVTLSRGEIDPSTFSLAEMSLPDDVLDRLVEDPAGTFFLSEAEAERVAKAAKQGRSQALEAYRAVLSARAKAYWEGGLEAIEPYAGKNRSPKVDLASANEAARKLVQNPRVHEALEAVPSRATGPAIHRLTWAIEKGRDQAAPVLSHRILYKEKDGQVLVERRFYSGYDYDDMQKLVGILPARSGKRCVVFYTDLTYTAQVAGFGGGAKRAIGRKLMQNELIAEMKRAQQAIAKR
jgi:hypothetical protein